MIRIILKYKKISLFGVALLYYTHRVLAQFHTVETEKINTIMKYVTQKKLDSLMLFFPDKPKAMDLVFEDMKRLPGSEKIMTKKKMDNDRQEIDSLNRKFYYDVLDMEFKTRNFFWKNQKFRRTFFYHNPNVAIKSKKAAFLDVAFIVEDTVFNKWYKFTLEITTYRGKFCVSTLNSFDGPYNSLDECMKSTGMPVPEQSDELTPGPPPPPPPPPGKTNFTQQS